MLPGAVPRPSRVALTHATAGGVVGKVNPSIGTEADGQALWRAVQDDRIDTIVSDHACCAEEDKGEYLWKAPQGCGCAAGRPIRCSEAGQCFQDGAVRGRPRGNTSSARSVCTVRRECQLLIRR